MSLDLDPEQDGASPAPVPARPLADASPGHPPDDAELRWSGPLGLRAPEPEALRTATWTDDEQVELHLELERATTFGPLHELVAPDLPLVEPDPAAVALVRRCFEQLGGTGIVVEPTDGEAAPWVLPLLLAELVARGLGDHILVAGAPGTAERLARDVRDRTGVELAVALSSGSSALGAARLALDHDLAEAEVEVLSARRWDLVVVAAAHHVSGDDAAHVRGALSRLLRAARGAVLLTPAPARDDLVELRRLAELVRPGTFRPEPEFRARLVDPDVRHTPSRPDELRRLLGPVLVRTPAVASNQPPARTRLVEHHEVEPSPEELAATDAGIALVAGALAGPSGWEARRRLVPHLAGAGAGLAVAARAAAEVAPAEARDGLAALAEQAGALPPGPGARLLRTLTKLWVAEHGRVLVVASSDAAAEVVAEGLVADGVEAVQAWAGSPPADLVDRPVVVASDAALAASRLGSFGCVVCADLPWDPVVVDDRLLAAGDEGEPLVVATFGAADSVDATVATVLEEQVQLYGHPGGWARTLLGELDPATAPTGEGDAPLSFSDRLVVALTEDPDDVEAALEDLADDLEAARRRTRLLLEAAERMDSWLSDDQEEADEPRPAHPSAAVLRDLLARRTRADGGRVVRHEPGLLVTDGLLGTGERRWTFDRAGRWADPTAELVAPGSPAFAELVAALRATVPVSVEVAEPVDLPVVDPDGHVESITLVDRLLEPPSAWSAVASWRVRSGATEEALVEVTAGSPAEARCARRPLDRDEPLPKTLPSPPLLTEQLLEATATTLADDASALADRWRSAADASRARLLVHHHAAVDAARAAIEESVVGTPEHDRATDRLRALHAEHPSELAADGDDLEGRMRADLVAVRLTGGDDFQVVERWRHVDGAEAEVRYPWDPDGAALRRSEVSGEAVAVLALCHDGHVVDEAELVVCPSCLAAGCDACGVVRALAPCPTCGDEVCGTCRLHEDRFGPCPGCRAPQRDEQADTEHGRAWRLGGEATLLVGARWAELRRSPSEPSVVVVPDEDLEDPMRQRLRRAADALGLPLDVGTGGRARGPRPLPGPDDLWLQVEPGVHWKVEPAAGHEVAEPLGEDFDGPDGPDPLVDAEAHHEVGELLRRLRAEVEPPAPPSFVRTPHLDVARTTLEAGGLVRTLDRVGADGTVERLAEDRADLESAAVADDQLFRPVAEARLEPVEVALARLHRSSVVRTTTPTGTQEWFVPADEALTFGTELAWASWVEEEGLALGAVLLVDPERPALADEELADPDGVDLVRRSIVDVWGAVPLDGGEADAPLAGPEHLALVGYDEVPDLAMRRPDATHAELALALHETGAVLDPVEPARHLLAHRWFEVEESWQGRSPVRLAYKVAPDEPAWPRLDDTHQRAGDFELDDHGHLHEPGTGWQCLACGEHHCRACGPVGAMEACPACEQDACGLCRARTPRPVAEERCDVCGDRSCGDCGREPDTAACGVCRRSVCRRCQVDPARAPDQEHDEPARCRACASLRPALAEEVDGLPEVLAAHGLQVLIGASGGEVALVLLGAWRTEVAVLRGGAVHWWVHHDDEEPATRRLLLAAARRWSPLGDVVPVGTGWSTRPEVEGPGLLLVAEEVPEVRWSLEVDDESVAGSSIPPRPAGAVAPERLGAVARLEAGVVEVVLAEVGGPDVPDEPMPAPGVAAGDPLAAMRDARDLEAGARLLVEDRQRATATWLTPDGLQRLTSEGDDDRRTQAPWQVGVSFSWMTEGWEPRPDVVAYSFLGELEAALVRVGRHLALGIRGDERVVWWALRDVPGDLQRILLGEHLTGEERLLDLRVVTDPGRVAGPTVLDATFVDRRIEPVLEEVGSQEGDPDEALRAAAAWVRREAVSPAATGPELPADLRAALVQRADELSPPELETVGIALQVVETWRQGIDDFLVPYRLSPGTTAGLITCADTGAGAPIAHRDRSGHLVATVEQCPWCEAKGCAACDVRVRACPVCSVGVCDRCALDDGRCPTCATLAVVDRKEVKRLGLKVGRKALVLRAESDVRTVQAVREDGWRVEVLAMGTPVEVLEDDRRLEVLDRVASSPALPPQDAPQAPQPDPAPVVEVPDAEEATPPT